MEQFEIGCDIQLIEEFRKPKRGFLKKIFTNSEISYCSNKSNPAIHLAARFAAKEAVMKALFQFKEKTFYNDIEILINNKKPEIRILKPLKAKYTIKTSLSHSKDYALAFVIVQKNGMIVFVLLVYHVHYKQQVMV